MITVVVTPKCGKAEDWPVHNLSSLIVDGSFFVVGEIEYNLQSISSVEFYQPGLANEQWTKLLIIKEKIHRQGVAVHGYDHVYESPKKLDFSHATKEAND